MSDKQSNIKVYKDELKTKQLQVYEQYKDIKEDALVAFLELTGIHFNIKIINIKMKMLYIKR